MAFLTLEEHLRTFDYHQPDPDGIDRIAQNRRACKELVQVLWKTTPPGPDLTAAIRKVHEAMLTANKAIVLYVPVKLEAGKPDE